ncbi:hypothetical protein HYQ45_016983 [Verticillium longisporum]|uniref:MICOS complex subunit MIC12 n=2 Tax=Verticillium TaxID=1036719 RepID=A0A8I2Z5F7_VERLO|nr:hypothetical protein HYQ45_016983 [Verticillium longisporum]PNH74436.1 hypothetical protein VD0001_g3136 [Verticillium dahliae]RBQ82702.1 hypothetical protein VDGD_01485 [Verticillium dahliae]RXG45074.1 hypothetical protein VDGE_01485 [Verticillium dahliae]
MGVTTGLTGGVTLTLGLAYLAVQTHQRTREHQSQLLRSQARVLDSFLEPVVPAPPPTRHEIEAAKRANLVDTAKDRWNAEVEGAVHYLQRTDWDDVRAGLEDAASRAWRSAFGDPEPQIDEAKRRAAAGGRELAREGKEIAREAKGAWERAREKTAAAGEARAEEARVAAEQARVAAERRAAELKALADRKAVESKDKAEDVLEAGKREAGRLVDKVKEVVGIVDDKAEDAAKAIKTDAVNLVETGTSTPVERALRERYEKKAPVTKSVADVLAERYLPTDAKDYSHLRGL